MSPASAGRLSTTAPPGKPLFPLHLFGLVSFYLAPLPVRYFSVFSFCRITVFEVSFPEAAGLYFLLLLLSAPSGEVSPVACIGFLMGGTGACILVGGAESFPSDE